jgi:hypothetical protein
LILKENSVNQPLKLRVMLLAALVTGAAVAAEPSPIASKEIQHLFTYLETSGCQFFRNGSWHSAHDASKHLQQKYKYLLNRGMISSAESFIERGASESSMSNKPYQVRCGNAAKPDTSAAWFKAELARYRAAAK